MSIQAPEVTLGVRIYMARRQAGLDQKALAAVIPGRAGRPINRATLGGWERDQGEPNVSQLRAIAEATESPFEWLVGAHSTYFATDEQLSLFSDVEPSETRHSPVFQAA